MAGKGEAAINWKPDPAKPPYPFKAKEADSNESFRQKGFSIEEYDRW